MAYDVPIGLNPSEQLAFLVGRELQVAIEMNLEAIVRGKKAPPQPKDGAVMAVGAVFFATLLGAWRNPDWLHMVCSRITSSSMVDATMSEWGEILAKLIAEGAEVNMLRVLTLEDAYRVAKGAQ